MVFGFWPLAVGVLFIVICYSLPVICYYDP